MDLRHETIFFYVTFCFLWFLIITPLMAEAQLESTTGYNASINTSYNNSSWDATQASVSWNLMDFVNNLISFHFSVWYIDVFIVGLGTVLLAYSAASLFPPGA